MTRCAGTAAGVGAGVGLGVAEADAVGEGEGAAVGAAEADAVEVVRSGLSVAFAWCPARSCSARSPMIAAAMRTASPIPRDCHLRARRTWAAAEAAAAELAAAFPEAAAAGRIGVPSWLRPAASSAKKSLNDPLV